MRSKWFVELNRYMYRYGNRCTVLYGQYACIVVLLYTGIHN